MIRFLFGITFLTLFTACSNKELPLKGSASLIIYHAIPGANPMITNFSNVPPAQFITSNAVHYGQFSYMFNMFNRISGTVPLNLYQFPDTAAGSKPFLNISMDLTAGSINSLFLTGTAAAPETILLKDEPLYFERKDSSMGIRFINLLPDNIPVSINIRSKANGSEVVSLPYKSATAFKKYAVTMDLADYEFEFRNAGTGVLIATYTTIDIANNGQLSSNLWLNKNFTLALIGKDGETGSIAPRVDRIDYTR